jgi:hypothetical protein
LPNIHALLTIAVYIIPISTATLKITFSASKMLRVIYKTPALRVGLMA